MEDNVGSGVGMSSRTSYWCHMCSQVVNPIAEVELKCPICHGGFVEEMDHIFSPGRGGRGLHLDIDVASGRSLSLWAPILLGIMGNPRERRRLRPRILDDEENDVNDRDNADEDRVRTLPLHSQLRLQGEEGESESISELYRELDSIIRRRRRSSATILQLLRGIRATMAVESEHPEQHEGERERDGVILSNPFNQTIIIQGSYDSSHQDHNRSSLNQLVSLGDYFFGPGLDMLLQHLADQNDLNRNGTPPAHNEEIEALPMVKIEESLQCSVCLDDFELGSEAKEMPCKHKFHSGCILPWLELHSSCPLCRYQLLPDEPKRHPNPTRSHIEYGNSDVAARESDVDAAREDQRGGNERRLLSLPWPLSTLFSSTGSQYIDRNSSLITQSAESATGENTVAPRIDEN